jgi:chromate reductase
MLVAMRILAVCGSLQAKSSNLSLLQLAQRLAPNGVEITLFDGLARLPQFNPDLEQTETLPEVDALRRAVAESDALLIACPEYGHSLPGSLKNAVDWLIGTGELESKIVAITAAVPAPERGRRGLAALAGTLGAVSAHIVGGEPIARGPAFEQDVAKLVAALVARVTAADCTSG